MTEYIIVITRIDISPTKLNANFIKTASVKHNNALTEDSNTAVRYLPFTIFFLEMPHRLYSESRFETSPTMNGYEEKMIPIIKPLINTAIAASIK